MNEPLIRAGFLRRLGSVVVDAIVIFVPTTVVNRIWSTRELGELPESPAEFSWLVDAGQAVTPARLFATRLVYMVVS